MLRVAICDDDKNICAEIEKIILKNQKQFNLKMEVNVFFSGETLLSFIKSENSFDLIFLDIELGNITGVDVGDKIRNELDDHISKIVYVSSKNGYEQELFDIQPLNFLRKPIEEKKIIKCIELAIKLCNIERKSFEYRVSYEYKKVNYNRIIFFESKLRKIKIVTFDGTDNFYGKFTELKDVLPKNFVSPHASFIVNFDNISVINKDKIVMLDLSEIPISQRNMKNLRQFQLERAKEERDVHL